MTIPVLGPSVRGRLFRQLVGYSGVALAVVVYSFIATQWLAGHFGYNRDLGPDLGSTLYPHLYQPFAWVTWFIRFFTYDRALWMGVWFSVCAASMVTLFAVVFWIGFTTRSSVPYHGLRGDARFITELDELRGIGLVAGTAKKVEEPTEVAHSLYLGACEDEDGTLHYLRLTSNEHLAVVAPTRTGKGVGPVVMNCVAWPGCLINFDPKGENFYATAPARAEIGPVYRWNPTATENTHSYNFLESIRLRSIHEMGDAMDIATLLVDPSSVGNWDHWKGTGFSFLAGLILFVKYTKDAVGKRASLADVAFAMGDPEKPNMKLYAEMAQNKFGKPTMGGFTMNVRHDPIAVAGQEMLNKDSRERASVHSTAVLALALYKDPIIAHNTARSDFHLEDLWNGEQPGSLYMTVSADQELKLQPLLRMMITLIIRALQRAELQYELGRARLPWKHRTLYVFDEFASLGTVKEIELALSRIAGWGVQLMLVIQGIPQLYQGYTQYQAVLEGCQAKVVYAPNDKMTAEWLSEGCGMTTSVKTDIKVSGSRFGAMLGYVNQGYEEVEHRLLTVQQAGKLEPPTKGDDGKTITAAGACIVLRTGYNAIFCRQLLYFLDPYFLNKVQKAMPPGIFPRRVTKPAAKGGANTPTPAPAAKKPAPASPELPLDAGAQVPVIDPPIRDYVR